ncbi:TSPAN9 [Mytilus coruscus]|uniref:TSPAN9 n=1 Tax=Mytilus coruscus TaxID=42192 RepID=A0A6J8BCW7_MYTCO|nr:TSPAN9 [Mytilus coruscus]
MAKVRRGRFTLSANIIITASLITRTLAFGYIMMSIYIKVGDDILDEDVIKVVDMEDVAGMPLGTTVKSILWSLIGIFVLELITGIFGIWGAIGRRQRMLSVKSRLRDTLYTYTLAYHQGTSYVSSTYYWSTFQSFLSELGCDGINTAGVYYCYENFNEQLSSYLKTYFGLIVTSIVCQVVTIVATEYTYRKFEFKEKKPKISDNKYYILLTLQHGIFRNVAIFVRDNWRRSKLMFISVSFKICSLLRDWRILKIPQEERHRFLPIVARVHVIGTGLLGLGLTLIGDKFIHDSALRYIFRQMQFHNYYFYDILVGLAASAVVIGVLTMITSITGLIGSWRKSSKLSLTSSVMSNILHIPRIIAIIVWIYLVEEIDDGMKFQLGLQQSGYYYGGSQNTLTRNWNEMIMTLQCCGVNYYYETWSTTYGNRFCCTNAHESRMDPGSHYNNNDNNILYYFGGCYEHKTDILGLIFANKEYLFISTLKNVETKTEYESTATSIFRTAFQGIQSFLMNNWRRSRMTLVYLISLIVLFISNVGLLGIAIHIRYDTVFGNSDVKAILSRLSISDHTFSKALNIFSIVVSTFSSLSIVAIMYSIVSIVSWRWRRIFLYTSAGLWSVILVANIAQIGLWGKFISSVDSDLEGKMRTELTSQYSYMYSHASGHHHRETSLSWNTLFVKAECCGVGTYMPDSFTSSDWYMNRRDSTSQHIPVQCCKSQTEVYPYTSISDTNCTYNLFNGYYHSQGCDSVVEVVILAEISCIVITIYDAVHLPSEPNTLHVEEKVKEGKIRKRRKKKKIPETQQKVRGNNQLKNRNPSLSKKTDETEKVKNNIEIQSLEETKKENERTRTSNEEMLDSKHLNKTENTNDDKKEETDLIDQHKNDETENMHQEKEDKTMKDTSIQITEETALDRTEVKDKLIEDVDAEDLDDKDL